MKAGIPRIAETAGSVSHPALRTLLARPFPAVMGVLNVTPDSFSDGGRFDEPERALVQAQRMIGEGADILDLGAESTRPYGSEPVGADEERRRLKDILPQIVALGVPVSIDTQKASIAAWALEQGVLIANDIWGLQGDPDMARVIAEHNAPAVVMHNRSSVDASIDIVADLCAFFERTLDIAAKTGIPPANLVLDPGIGFGKTPEQSMTVLARIDDLKRFGLPILVGASRKRFIASVVPSEPQQRLGGSIAAHVLAALRGAKIIRAHDVAETVQALRVAAAIEDRQ